MAKSPYHTLPYRNLKLFLNVSIYINIIKIHMYNKCYRAGIMDLAMDVDAIDIKEEIGTEDSSPLLEITPTDDLEPVIDVPAFQSCDLADIDPLLREEFRILQIDSLISSLQNAICTEEDETKDEDVVPIAIPFIVSLYIKIN
jgi:hypothetical protein